jgi:hypothetical protein
MELYLRNCCKAAKAAATAKAATNSTKNEKEKWTVSGGHSSTWPRAGL